MYPQGHLAILRGNLATEGAVAKITGVKKPVITGTARVFESEEASLNAILAGKFKLVIFWLSATKGPKAALECEKCWLPLRQLSGLVWVMRWD